MGVYRWAPLLAVAAVALAGCTAPTADDDTTRSDAVEELDAYLDVVWAYDPAAPNPAAVQFEEVMADCMGEAGFDYYPDRTAGMGFLVSDEDAGEVAYAEVYGYGMSLEGPGGTPPRFWATVPPSEASQRNAEYRASLSPEALVQYDLAMSGDWSEHSAVFDEVIAGDVEYDPQRAGCSGRASEVAYPDGAAGPAELGEVKEAVSGMWQRLQEDGRITQTLPAWSACMQDAGYPAMTELVDAENYLSIELWAEWQDSYANATPGNVGVTDYDVVKESIPDALRELQEAEIALAVADATCRVESGYADAYAEAEAEIAQEILDTYRADLDTWVAWAAEQQAG